MRETGSVKGKHLTALPAFCILGHMGKESVEKFVDRDLLFDFYAELLTEHQRHIFEAVAFLDCSLSEVAKEAGISRQGVSDLVRRTEEQLYAYESKLHLAEKFRAEQRIVRAIAAQCKTDNAAEALSEIQKLADELLQLTAR